MATHLTPELLWQIPRVGRPVAAGSTIVVPVTTYDLEENEGTTRLWQVDGDTPRPLTGETTSATAPALSPDGARLAFVRKVDGRGQIHVMPLDGGEARPVTDLPLGASAPRWTPDGAGIVCLASVYRDAFDLEAAAVRRDELDERKVSAHVTEGRMYRYWDRWLTDGRVPHLFLIHPDTGEATDLTPTSTIWWAFDNTGDPGLDFDFSPDGTEIAFAAMRSDDPNLLPTRAIYTVGIEGGTPVRITDDGPGSASRPRYTPDGSAILYGRQRRDDFYADRTRLTRHDRTSGEISTLIEDWDRSPAGWVFTDSGDLIFSAEDDGGAKLFLLAPDDAEPVALTSGGTASSPSVTDGGIAYVRQSLQSPPEIYRLAGASETRITEFTAAALDGIELRVPEDVRYAGADGDEIQMFVVTPPGYDPDQVNPLVHLIHGGPHGVFGDTWHWRWNAQVFAAAGYVVAMVNFHGSTSWGQEHAASIMGSWGDQPYRDVEAATDLLVARGGIDPERMAVTGGSYGGYLTAWITSQTDRYRCAVAHAAVTNLGGMYASDVVFHRATAYGAEYWEDRQRVELWSPSAHAAGYSTPTLVIHGELDYRVPLTQGLELYGVLKAKGVEARLVYYPDENHWILKPQNSLHWYGEFLGWLDRHLGKK